jgi:hypothetical protein
MLLIPAGVVYPVLVFCNYMLQMSTALHDQLIYISIRKSAVMWRFVFHVIPLTACPVLGGCPRDIFQEHMILSIYISVCAFLMFVFTAEHFIACFRVLSMSWHLHTSAIVCHMKLVNYHRKCVPGWFINLFEFAWGLSYNACWDRQQNATESWLTCYLRYFSVSDPYCLKMDFINFVQSDNLNYFCFWSISPENGFHQLVHSDNLNVLNILGAILCPWVIYQPFELFLWWFSVD